MKWFRFYSTALDDPKIQRMPAELFRSWVNLLCLANEGEGDERGNLPSVADIAFRLRLTDEEAERTIADLTERGLIDEVDETLQPHNWEQRQYVSDNVTERVRKHRAKHDDDVSDNVTGNDDETLHETLQDEPGNVTRNADVTSQIQIQNRGRTEQILATEKPSRRRDLLFETLVEATGIDVRNDLERGRVNKALKSLRECEATPDEIERAVSRYRKRWPDIELTAMAIASNWSALMKDDESRSSAPPPLYMRPELYDPDGRFQK